MENWANPSFSIRHMKFILGEKIEMSQVFDEKGNIVPVTLVEAGPCQITQLKTREKDGYEAVQIGFKKLLKDKKIGKSRKTKPFKYLREFRDEIDSSKLKVGDEISAAIFQKGEKVKISGVSKGKGYAGVVKRWGFSGFPASHGTKDKFRAPGSIGMRWPQRVAKGKKMAGRMGAEKTTVKNLEIIKVDPENNLLAIKGALPGRKGTLLEIKN